MPTRKAAYDMTPLVGHFGEDTRERTDVGLPGPGEQQGVGYKKPVQGNFGGDGTILYGDRYMTMHFSKS